MRRSAGNWLEFRLPGIFYVNTAVILLSSLTLQLSFNAFKNGLERRYKNLLIATFLLGLTFVVLQYFGWSAMTEIGGWIHGKPVKFVYLGDFGRACGTCVGGDCGFDRRTDSCVYLAV